MNELIMPHNVGVKNALENMNEVLAVNQGDRFCFNLQIKEKKNRTY